MKWVHLTHFDKPIYPAHKDTTAAFLQLNVPFIKMLWRSHHNICMDNKDWHIGYRTFMLLVRSFSLLSLRSHQSSTQRALCKRLTRRACVDWFPCVRPPVSCQEEAASTWWGWTARTAQPGRTVRPPARAAGPHESHAEDQIITIFIALLWANRKRLMSKKQKELFNVNSFFFQCLTCITNAGKLTSLSMNGMMLAPVKDTAAMTPIPEPRSAVGRSSAE